MQKTMQANHSRSLAFRLKTVSAAVASALIVAHASAAGLGKLTVLSGIGQPLRAEIEVTAASAEEARNLQPKLASMEAFRQANIEFNPTLQTLRFAVEQRGARQFIRITTSQPISEPFVDVLLELGGPDGRLVREYTFLLDPPELRATQPVQTTQAAPVVAATTAANTVRPAPVPASATRGRAPQENEAVARAVPAPRPQRAPVREPAAAKPPGGNPTGTEYRVQPGDSLSKIAGRTKTDGISLDQMLVALYRANPEAFVGNNMNRLRAGQILSVPGAETVGAVGAPEAEGIVIAQAADFNAYRNKLAGQVSTGPARQAPEGRHSASGKIEARVEERPTPASESLDKLKLSKAEGAGAGNPAAQEDKAARDRAAADAAARVKDLEKNISDLQKLLEVKNKDLAARQNNTDAPAVTPAKPVAADAIAVAVPAAAKTDAPPAPPKTAAGEKPATGDKPSTPPAQAPARPKTAGKLAATEPGLLDDPLGNPLVQGGAVLLALALGGFAFMRSRAKKQPQPFDDSVIADSSLKNNSLFGATGGQSVDTNNSVFNSSFAPAASNLDTNEVDPVAEADVYIAYGRDVQAEEILKEALRTQPERHAVRVKLLEIYASRKDTRAFESVATELYSMSKGEGEDWAQAAGMGIALDPVNPLYASGKAPAPNDAGLHNTTRPLDDDHADLDAFLEEVSAAHPFAETTASPAPTAPSVPEPVVVQTAVAKPADDGLDFDLDGLSFDAVDRTPADAAPVPAPATGTDAAPLAALDFDFLQDAPGAAPAEPPASVVPPRPPAGPVDFSALHLDTNDGVAPAESPSPEAEQHRHDVPHTVTAMTPAPAIPDTAFARPEALEFDLSGITLDLPEPREHEAPLMLDLPAQAAAPAVASNFAPASRFAANGASAHEDFTELDLTTLADHDVDGAGTGIGNSAEMATKLDLAVAYQEIGDQEGARELLDEVLRGGSAVQSEKAKSLLARLG